MPFILHQYYIGHCTYSPVLQNWIRIFKRLTYYSIQEKYNHNNAAEDRKKNAVMKTCTNLSMLDGHDKVTTILWSASCSSWFISVVLWLHLLWLLIVFVKGAECNSSAEYLTERHHQCLSQHQINPRWPEGCVREDWHHHQLSNTAWY